jgi:glycine hydroxymethyltransferase
MIFYRKGVRSTDKKGNQTMFDLEQKINDSIFPGHQGGPHCNNMAGIGTALHIAQTPEFKDYVDRCMDHSKKVSAEFGRRGYPVMTGGTDNHMTVIDIKHLGVDGARAEHALGLSNIAVSKQSIPGDKSAVTPRGLRVGVPCMTARGFEDADWMATIDFIDRGVKIAKELKEDSNTKKLNDYKQWTVGVRESDSRVAGLKNEVTQFCNKFDFIPWNN